MAFQCILAYFQCCTVHGHLPVCVCDSMLDNGGWTVLHNWLLHSKANDSRTFLIELLKLYKRLPVTVEMLRQNSCAKDIKQLSKCPDASMSLQSQHCDDVQYVAVIVRWRCRLDALCSHSIVMMYSTLLS